MSKTFLTGIKPTGVPHLGNLLGAIKPALEMVNKEPDAKFIYFVADYHALTGKKDPEAFAKSIYDVAATWIAFGLDPKKVIFYKQSDLPEIFELSWILACHTPKGDMNRAHSYKAAIDANSEKGQKDLDHGINMGLYTYPILMSADILLFDTNIVPVGKDQVQHVEIARSIAQRFNQYYGDTLTLPQELITENAAIVPGLDGRKMSKSYDNTIPLFVPEKRLKKLINKITTDSSAPEDPKDPNESHIFSIYRQFANEEQIETLRERFTKGISWGEAKAELFTVLNDYLQRPREIYDELIANPEELERLLADGAQRARELASTTMIRVRKSLKTSNKRSKSLK